MVFHALSWIFVACLLACWSFLAWVFHGAANWAVSQADKAGGVPEALAALSLPDGLVPWLPAEAAQGFSTVLASLAPVVEVAVRLASELSGPLSILTWVVWAVGAFVLLMLGIGLSGLIFWAGRRDVAAVPPRLRLG